MRIGIFGAAVSLALLPGLAGAEDHSARLRDVAEQVAVLATSWEPDLEAALQRVAPGFQLTEMGAGADRLDDPLRDDVFVAPPPASHNQSVAISGAGCSRMGPKTLAFYRSSPAFRGGAADMFVGDAFVDRPEVRPYEIHLLMALADLGSQEPLLDASQILTCAIMISQQGGVTTAEWEAMTDGLRSGFDDVVFQAGTAGPDTFGLGEWGNHLTVGAAHDPATRVVWFRVAQFPDEATGEANAGQIMIEFMVWRGAETS